MAGQQTLTRKDFQSDQEVRWCPGCGDYAILKAMQTVLPELGVARENLVIISGIGCSSRFPYYMNTYGFHTIHGRAPTFATGLKTTRPDLDVWVITGDGDSLSIGGNHLIHAMRRNVGIKILMFNNRIYGLTKGQYSPTSEIGKRTASTPAGSVDTPFNPLALALGSGATFVARSVDILQKHLLETLRRAAAHQGTAFVEIYQNCNIFNDQAFGYMTAKDQRADGIVYLEDGKPVVFGADGAKGLALSEKGLEVVETSAETAASDCLVWDEAQDQPTLANLMAYCLPPQLPTPLGVLRAVERQSFEAGVIEQIQEATERQGHGSLEALLHSGDVWTVGEDATAK